MSIKKCRLGFNKIYHIQSIKNFEDEISFASNLKNVNPIFKTATINDFKKEFMHCSNLQNKLEQNGFEIDKLWSRESKDKLFDKYSNKEDLNIIHRKSKT